MWRRRCTRRARAPVHGRTKDCERTEDGRRCSSPRRNPAPRSRRTSPPDRPPDAPFRTPPSRPRPRRHSGCLLGRRPRRGFRLRRDAPVGASAGGSRGPRDRSTRRSDPSDGVARARRRLRDLRARLRRHRRRRHRRPARRDPQPRPRGEPRRHRDLAHADLALALVPQVRRDRLHRRRPRVRHARRRARDGARGPPPRHRRRPRPRRQPHLARAPVVRRGGGGRARPDARFLRLGGLRRRSCPLPRRHRRHRHADAVAPRRPAGAGRRRSATTASSAPTCPT